MEPITVRQAHASDAVVVQDMLEEAAQWIEMYRSHWERRLDMLEGYLERKKGDRK